MVIVFIDFKSAQPSPRHLQWLQQLHLHSQRTVSRVSSQKWCQAKVARFHRCYLTLLNSVVDAITRKAFEGRQSVRYDENWHFTDLMFADNFFCAFFVDDAEATGILNDIANAAHPYG